MSTSTTVAIALFALFVVYITARGRLPQYLAILFGPVSTQGANTVANAPGTTSFGLPTTGSASGTVRTLPPVLQPGIGGAFATSDFTDLLSPSSATGGLY